MCRAGVCRHPRRGRWRSCRSFGPEIEPDVVSDVRRAMTADGLAHDAARIRVALLFGQPCDVVTQQDGPDVERRVVLRVERHRFRPQPGTGAPPAGALEGGAGLASGAVALGIAEVAQ